MGRGMLEVDSVYAPLLSPVCDLSAVVKAELPFGLIDNMLDGKLWLFPSRQKKEGEISSPVSFDLQTLHISSEQMTPTDI